FGVVGYGYWGPNIVRNLEQLEETEVVAVCDKSPASRRRVQKSHPNVYVTDDCGELMSNPAIDAVAVITPVWTHYEIAKLALQNGKHVFVEKPFTSNSAQAEELIELAASKNLKIMVDHTFLFTGAVKKIRQVLHENVLGKLYYYDSTRVNLGLFQHDVNVVWDLAPHDLSIIDHLIDEAPEAVVATGQTHLNGHEDIAFITLYFPDSVIAHINVNWLSPVKVRTTLIGGEKKMLVWNDLEADEKIRIYDKGVNVTTQEGVYNLLVNYRSGDMWAPQLERVEALRAELSYFVHCINQNETPFNDGMAGYRVVKMLEAATESMHKRGALVYLSEAAGVTKLPVSVINPGIISPAVQTLRNYRAMASPPIPITSAGAK
ncbi:MAG TPA: Gfo/Idh/MocA family oxidoreductase, partial [Candidatus Binatia bacterium]|nr:Gfo/Idh/MocA family oxidoreductase [Candidatus Binatia bacterium]